MSNVHVLPAGIKNNKGDLFREAEILSINSSNVSSVDWRCPSSVKQGDRMIIYGNGKKYSCVLAVAIASKDARKRNGTKSEFETGFSKLCILDETDRVSLASLRIYFKEWKWLKNTQTVVTINDNIADNLWALVTAPDYVFSSLEDRIAIVKEKPNSLHVSNKNSIREIDFIGRYQNQILNGKLAEKLVLNFERDFFVNNGKSELADKVEIVSNDERLGYDILSYDNNGSEKHIEVKCAQSNSEHYSYFMSQNQLAKCKDGNLNYWFYLVIDIGSNQPKIYKFAGNKIQKDYLKETHYSVIIPGDLVEFVSVVKGEEYGC